MVAAAGPASVPRRGGKACTPREMCHAWAAAQADLAAEERSAVLLCAHAVCHELADRSDAQPHRV